MPRVERKPAPDSRYKPVDTDKRWVRNRSPVTLPTLSFSSEPPDNREKAEAMIRLRVIRAGRDAWQEISKAESFDSWKLIGAALAIGKEHALRITQANAAWGRNYSKAFGEWMKEHGFTDMRPSDKSYAIALHEHFSEIVAWRAGLSDKQRSRLTTAQSNVKRWRATTVQRPACSAELRTKATMHWRRFLACMKALPPGEAEALWKSSLGEMMVP
jgi:hypothetical protein